MRYLGCRWDVPVGSKESTIRHGSGGKHYFMMRVNVRKGENVYVKSGSGVPAATTGRSDYNVSTAMAITSPS